MTRNNLFVAIGAFCFTVVLIVAALLLAGSPLPHATTSVAAASATEWTSRAGDGLIAPACGSTKPSSTCISTTEASVSINWSDVSGGVADCTATLFFGGPGFDGAAYGFSYWGGSPYEPWYKFKTCSSSETIQPLPDATSYSYTVTENWTTGTGDEAIGQSHVERKTISTPACLLPPTASISQSSGATIQGTSYTINWSTNQSVNTCTVYRKIPGGSFAPWASSTGGGSKSDNPIPPSSSAGTYQYYAACSNDAGSDTSAVISHTVQAKNPIFNVTPDTINEGDPVSISWSCYYSSSSSGSNFSTGGAVSDSKVIDPGPSTTTTYGITCSNGGSAQRTVTVRVPTVSILADPTLIRPNDISTVSWSASGVNSCGVSGPGITDSAPPPDLPGGATWNASAQTPPLVSESVYRISCDTAIDTYVKRVFINIVPDVIEE